MPDNRRTLPRRRRGWVGRYHDAVTATHDSSTLGRRDAWRARRSESATLGQRDARTARRSDSATLGTLRSRLADRAGASARRRRLRYRAPVTLDGGSSNGIGDDVVVDELR